VGRPRLSLGGGLRGRGPAGCFPGPEPAGGLLRERSRERGRPEGPPSQVSVGRGGAAAAAGAAFAAGAGPAAEAAAGAALRGSGLGAAAGFHGGVVGIGVCHGLSWVGLERDRSGWRCPRAASIHPPLDWRVKRVLVWFPARLRGQRPPPRAGPRRHGGRVGGRSQAKGGLVARRCWSSRGSTTPLSTRLVITATATRASSSMARSVASRG